MRRGHDGTASRHNLRRRTENPICWLESVFPSSDIPISVRMMNEVAVLLVAAIGSAAAFVPHQQQPLSGAVSQLAGSKEDLIAIAEKANPLIKFYDPMSLADGDFWDMGNDATIGWLRHSEIKHGRVAMAAFVGYCVQSNFIFPWPQHLDGTTGPGLDLSPEQQWDALPVAAKWQIFTFIGFLEVWDEVGGGVVPHYTKGRKPGQYPSLEAFRKKVHWAGDLFDPFGFSKNRSEEAKARGLVSEINNGRLAQLGIFGFLCADTIPDSVPALEALGAVTPYDGNCMIPFEGNFNILPLPP